MYLGDMNAFEFVAAINQTARWKTIPRILLAADAKDLAATDLQAHGFLGGLPKAADMMALAHLIATAFPGAVNASR
jgi:CheY-like chemotaxis protein